MTARTRLRASLVVLLLGGACRDAEVERSPATGTRIAVAESPDIGRYLADASGRAMYARLADVKGATSCYDTCADEWPPVPGTDPPAESTEPAVQPDLVGTLIRRDGGVQVTYAGHALYFRQSSPAAGTPERVVTDQHGTWSLLFPHGEPMAAPGQ